MGKWIWRTILVASLLLFPTLIYAAFWYNERANIGNTYAFIVLSAMSAAMAVRAFYALRYPFLR